MLYITIPASTGNLGSGFDVFGLAVRLYLHVSVERSSGTRTTVEFTGEGSDIISRSDNLILATIKRVLKSRGIKTTGFSLHVSNNIPIKRGLGSSGTARLAGVIAANYLSNLGMSNREIISAAIQLEGPPDNINSSFTGGLTASLVMENGAVNYRRCAFPLDLKLIFAIPDIQISTHRARQILPKKYALKDILYNLQRVSLIFEAVRSRDYDLLTHLLKDRLHQDYRAALVPGLKEILHFQSGNGLVGTFLSGSGPTTCALALDNFSHIGERMVSAFSAHGISARVLESKADNRGTRIVER
ncbi:hypothetical protein AMJ80_08175 [bacterium SM23_31]|nr:MAG: hypothetical protein AMJ80_08175 [bacterium SM23_31]